MKKKQSSKRKTYSGVYLVTVKGAMHNSFSDMPFIAPERYSNIEINAARALTITNAYILAFFDRYLRGRRQPLLKGNAPKFPEVTLQVYRPRKHPATAQAELSKRAYPLQSTMSGTSQDLIVRLD